MNMLVMEDLTDPTMSAIIKGKRTKRQRPASPLAAPLTSSSSTGQGGGGGGRGDGAGGGSDEDSAEEIHSSSMNEFPTSSSGTRISSEEEDEDMANCLILLAKSGSHKQAKREAKAESLMAQPTIAKVVSHEAAYKCKTCDRIFPSFQALGGHRASHKKPKISCDQEGEKPKISHSNKDQNQKYSQVITLLSLDQEGGKPKISHNTSDRKIQQQDQEEERQIKMPMKQSNKGNTYNKIHECSICGSEFSSGQALGGHMRRHRPPTNAAYSPPEDEKPRNILHIDLNLPATDQDDQEDMALGFSGDRIYRVFSSSALVGCHY